MLRVYGAGGFTAKNMNDDMNYSIHSLQFICCILNSSVYVTTTVLVTNPPNHPYTAPLHLKYIVVNSAKVYHLM